MIYIEINVRKILSALALLIFFLRPEKPPTNTA